jgi:hypothetical protein
MVCFRLSRLAESPGAEDNASALMSRASEFLFWDHLNVPSFTRAAYLVNVECLFPTHNALPEIAKCTQAGARATIDDNTKRL